MSYLVHLKTGFFKTTSCYIGLEEKDIVISPCTPEEGPLISIAWDSIREISFIEWENSIELDIYSSEGTYLCVMKNRDQAHRLANKLSKDFGVEPKFG